MRVVVSAHEPSLESAVDERFGRAMWFVVYDTESGSVTTIENGRNRHALQGAGIGAAECVSDSGAQAVITGHLGPKAFAALKRIGVRGYAGAGMTVREAIDALVEGRLREIVDAREAHAGSSGEGGM